MLFSVNPRQRYGQFQEIEQGLPPFIPHQQGSPCSSSCKISEAL
uniref:Uncharacterized protein n=1 Tax=Rhizophora mucronata TaxID=61149 RepID=A0A2P2KQC7_RHIMU